MEWRPWVPGSQVSVVEQLERLEGSKYQPQGKRLWIRGVGEQGQLERLYCIHILCVCVSACVMTGQARLAGEWEMRL